MSRVRYAGEFLSRCRQARQKYQETYQPLIEKIRKDFACKNDGLIPKSFDKSLEIHIREYFINHLLQALNWVPHVSDTGSLPNLVPESPIASISEGTTRFLDYFGIEQETGAPLLIVETKRPDSPPPKKKGSKAKVDFEQNSVGKDTISSIISVGLNETEELAGEWDEWLKTLKDYVQSVQARCNQVPKRVVLTSGRWMIIFTDPADSFFPTGTQDASRILVYELADEKWNESFRFGEFYSEIFQELEYHLVLGTPGTLNVAEVQFHIRATQVAKARHGLRILYIPEPDFWGSAKPQIKVAPVVFLRSNSGNWLMVEREESDERLPHSYNQLSEHLTTVREKAEALLVEIGDRLGISLQPSTIEEHYLNAEEFDQLPGVCLKPMNSRGAEQYLIVTGQHTHYLKSEPSVLNCPYHDWGSSQREGLAEPAGSAIGIRSVEQRSFFLTGQKHHCTHRNVALVKLNPVTLQNRDLCGLRSKKDDAFCEIISFEKHLCCRTCVYENVCAKAPVFRLPCPMNSEGG